MKILGLAAGLCLAAIAVSWVIGLVKALIAFGLLALVGIGAALWLVSNQALIWGWVEDVAELEQSVNTTVPPWRLKQPDESSK